MVERNSENPIPTIGVVLPSKEVPLLPPVDDQKMERPTGLRKFIQYLPDYKNFFAVVYHHTILTAQKHEFPNQVKGETNYSGSNVAFPGVFSLLNLLANMTNEMQLHTAVIVAPILQTAVLTQELVGINNASRGRLVAGVAAGYNEWEFGALGFGYRFPKRGKILDQQIEAMNLMATGQVVNLRIHTEFDEKGNPIRPETDEVLENVLINPPTKYPLNIAVGGFKKPAIVRAAKYGSGWEMLGDAGQLAEHQQFLYEQLEKFKRDKSKFNIVGRVALGKTPEDQWIDNFLEWRDLGASHVAITTTVDEKDEDEKNPNPDHHTGLRHKFTSSLEWLRHPEARMGRLFGESDSNGFEVPDDVALKFGVEKQPQHKKINSLVVKPAILPKHILMYFESHQFYRFNIDGVVKIPQQSDKMLNCIYGLRNDEGQTVVIMEEISDDAQKPKVIIAYSSDLEMGLRKL